MITSFMKSEIIIKMESIVRITGEAIVNFIIEIEFPAGENQ